MKKKIASLVLIMFCMITVLTGCNLFVTNYDSYLGQYVVSTNLLDVEGNKIVITKEELINGYYNYGSTLTNEYGYEYEDALDQVLDILLQRKVLLNHVKALAATEGAVGAKKIEYKYQLNHNELNEVVQECWDFIDEQLAEVEKEVKEDFDLDDDIFKETEKPETEFEPYSPYQTKLEISGNSVTRKPLVEVEAGEDPNEVYAWDEVKKELLNYKKPVYANTTVEKLVWSKYYETLKNNEASKTFEDRSNEAVFKRELERVYKINFENKYLKKFEETYTNSFGFDANGELNADVKQSILNMYTEMYATNKEVYDISKATLAEQVINSSNRADYVYYGEDETFITCMHILVKLSDDQIAKIKEVEANVQLSPDERKAGADQYRKPEETYATERDAEGYEIADKKVSVQKIYDDLMERIDAEVTATPGTEEYANDVAKIFNEFMYKYNQDPGIQNAEYDYVLGEKSSTMVESFTKTVRDLYENETPGAISSYILEENDNYSGFHIVLYTGTLKNVDPSTITVDNVVSKLHSIKTSRVSNQSIFEKLFDEYIAANVKYETYEANLIATLMSDEDVTYYRYRYSDLLS